MQNCFTPVFERLKMVSLCVVAAVAVALSFVSCINEDTSDCGCDQDISYDMSLHTNVETEISSQLQTQVEQNFAPQLRKSLKNIFTDYAKTNDLSFFVDGVRMRHEQNEMNSKTAKYTLYLDRNTYDHIALANVAVETKVDVLHGDTLANMVLQLQQKDTIDNQGYGIFAARKRILSTDFDHSTNIDVPLYMHNCATVVLINQSEVKAEELFGYVDGMTTTFHVQDSLYTTDRQIVTRANLVLPEDSETTETKAAAYISTANGTTTDSSTTNGTTTDSSTTNGTTTDSSTTNGTTTDSSTTNGTTTDSSTTNGTTTDSSTPGSTTTGCKNLAALYAVTFPSTTDEWRFNVIAKVNGEYKKSTLTIHESLDAGQLKIIKTVLTADGGLQTKTVNVAVSVSPWQDGSKHDVDL